jgi:hypothetical protein
LTLDRIETEQGLDFSPNVVFHLPFGESSFPLGRWEDGEFLKQLANKAIHGTSPLGAGSRCGVL